MRMLSNTETELKKALLIKKKRGQVTMPSIENQKYTYRTKNYANI